MRNISWISVIAAAIVAAGCSSVDLSAPTEDRSVRKQQQAAQTIPMRDPSREASSRYYGNQPEPVASGRVHTVERGDTLYAIGLRYGVDPLQIARLNGINDPTLIQPGQQLSIPLAPGETPPAPAASSEPPAYPADAAGSATVTSTGVRQGQPQAALAPTASLLSWPAQGRVIADFAATERLGIDIAGTMGAPVLAACDGTVQYVGSNIKGYGQFLILRHTGKIRGKGNTPITTVYGNTSKILVSMNQNVKAGQKIAEMGSSDSPTVKLRFEVRESGRPVDPMQYLPQ